MPLCDYRCERCGEFSLWRKMTEAGEPSICPACWRLAQRIISAPNISTMDSKVRVAIERNERMPTRRRWSCVKKAIMGMGGSFIRRAAIGDDLG